MKLREFMNSDRRLAMVITVGEYRKLRPRLVTYYTAKELADIDRFSRFAWDERRFLLCNLEEKSCIGVPMMYENAVTFVDRIPFRSIERDDEKKAFLVQITETYKRTVVIYADDQEEAEETAEELCSDDVIEIDIDSFDLRKCECIGCVDDDQNEENVLKLYQAFAKEDA